MGLRTSSEAQDHCSFASVSTALYNVPPFPDFGQSHLKCILLPFHLRVTNENSLLNVLSVRQECSFFRDYPKPVFQATASGSVNQPCSDMACSPLNQHRRTI